jgi:hypothetical protein
MTGCLRYPKSSLTPLNLAMRQLVVVLVVLVVCKGVHCQVSPTWSWGPSDIKRESDSPLSGQHKASAQSLAPYGVCPQELRSMRRHALRLHASRS